MSRVPAAVVRGLRRHERPLSWLAAAGFAALGVALFLVRPIVTVAVPPLLRDEATIVRGAYLVAAGGCAACHTDPTRPRLRFAGGLRIATPFGSLVASNLTPDPETGIGCWSDTDWLRAMKNGVSPRATHCDPVFPYRWYRRLPAEDLLAMKAWLETLPPIRRPEEPDELQFPYSVRFGVGLWKVLNLDDWPELSGATPAEMRGRPLVEGLGHCGACHTPTGFLGTFRDGDRHFAGAADVPGGYASPNLTADLQTGLGRWSDTDLLRVLAIGMRPDGTPVRGTMAEYVAEASSRLTETDRLAIVAYLRRVPAVSNRVARTREGAADAPWQGQRLSGGVSRDTLARGRAVAHGRLRCVACHAPQAAPLPVDPAIPVLASQAPAYLAVQLAAYADGTRANAVMTPIARALAPDDREAVAAWYGAQDPPWIAREVGPSPGLRDRPKDVGWHLAERGAPERGIAPCAACHDRDGTGFPPRYPAFSGQPARYLEAQFAWWRRGLRHNDPGAVMRAIAERLTVAEVRAVAAYYQGLAVPRAAPLPNGPIGIGAETPGAAVTARR